MGHMDISSNLSATSYSDKSTTIPTHTPRVNLVHFMQSKNPQKPEGNKKNNKKKIFNTKKGTSPTQKTQEGGTK
jgi:hypothetical protein